MGMINFSNPYVMYLIGGVVFNFIFDVLVSLLIGNDKENRVRFTMPQRLFAMIVWPLYTLGLIGGVIYHTFKNKTDD